MTLQPGTLIGKYIVRRKIAEGGMAEIYLASSQGPEGFEKEVVIKRVRPFLASDPGFVQMFIAEARLVSRLNHANLVQIFDFDKHEDTYYLAMEYVRGHSLWDVRRRSRELMQPMHPALVAHVGTEVARGLHYAHRVADKGKPLGLVHRDVTPHNVLLSFDGAVKLTDFGVAKAGNSHTAAGVLKGKFAYMSPEQSRGEPVDARTDVFALGIVLWECLTGGRLFDGDSDVAVLRAVQQSAIAPPARLNPDVRPELDAIVMRALERDVTARYQTAQELERALASFVLQNSKSIDETDLGAYLRTLFVDELAASEMTATRTPVGLSPQQPPPREPTQAMVPGRERATEIGQSPFSPSSVVQVDPSLGSETSPDEDAHGATFVKPSGGNMSSSAPSAPPAAPAPVPKAAKAQSTRPAMAAAAALPQAVMPAPDAARAPRAALAPESASGSQSGVRRGLVMGVALACVVGGAAAVIGLRRSNPPVVAPAAAPLQVAQAEPLRAEPRKPDVAANPQAPATKPDVAANPPTPVAQQGPAANPPASTAQPAATVKPPTPAAQQGALPPAPSTPAPQPSTTPQGVPGSAPAAQPLVAPPATASATPPGAAGSEPKKPEALQPASATAPAKSTAKVGSAVPARTGAARPGKGTLVLGVPPPAWANIFLDGGKTPTLVDGKPQRFELSAGRHHVKVVFGESEDSAFKEFDVAIEPDIALRRVVSK